MKVHYPKLYNMAHLSLNVFTASKGSNNYILFKNPHDDSSCAHVSLWKHLRLHRVFCNISDFYCIFALIEFLSINSCPFTIYYDHHFILFVWINIRNR